MLIDFIVLVLLAWGLFKGLRKGFIVGVFSFLAFLVGLAAAIKLSSVAAAYISQNLVVSKRWLPVLAFVLVFLLVVFLVQLGARALEGIVRIAHMGWLNKISGILLFSLLYVFIFSIIIFYAEQVGIIKEKTTASSISYPYLKNLGPQVIEGLGVIFPFFKNMFSELLQFFDGSAATAPKTISAL